MPDKKHKKEHKKEQHNNKTEPQEQKSDPKEDKIKELTETLQRLQAEFENFRKRSVNENNEFRKYANEGFIKKILPIIDHFELALSHKNKNEDFVKGIELIYSQLISTLEAEGIKKLDVINRPFDANTSEAMMVEVVPGKNTNDVIEVLQPGYLMTEKVIRHAKVKIAK